MRRVVLTRDFISFAREAEDIVVDKIPLSEVETVRDMLNSEEQNVDKGKFSNSLLISTTLDGHNSGRTYYLQAKSKNECCEIVTAVSNMAKKARERAEANSRFAVTQLFVRKFYESKAFQYFAAVLILAVSMSLY